MSDTDNPLVYLSDIQLRARYGVSKATIWRWAQEGRLPTPIRLGPRTTRWRSDEIEAFEKKRKPGGSS